MKSAARTQSPHTMKRRLSLLFTLAFGVSSAWAAAPVANAGPDQRAEEEALVSLNGGASSDADNDIVAFQWQQIFGRPVTLSSPFTASTVFRAPDDEGPLVFRLTVTDSLGQRGTDDVVVLIDDDRPRNRPPKADAGANQNVPEQTTVSLNGTGASDPDSDPLTFAWTQTAGPPVALAGPNTPTPSFAAPDVVVPTSLTFRLTVTDSVGQSDSAQTTVTVEPVAVNQPPQANAGADQVVNEGQSVALNGNGSSDPNGDSLTYSWAQVGGPTAPLNDPTAPSPSFTAPSVDTATSLTFRLTVSDPNGAAASDDVIVTVRASVAVNAPPLANAGPDESTNEGSVMRLNGTGSSDPNGDPLTFAWSQLSGPTVPLDAPGDPRPAFTAPDVAAATELVFRLTVSDPAGLTASDTIVVTVTPVVPGNRAPIAQAGPDQTVAGGEDVTLDGTASEDPDGGPLTYRWVQDTGPQIVFTDPFSPITQFRAPEVAGSAIIEIRLRVEDNQGGIGEDAVAITITGAAGQIEAAGPGLSGFKVAPNPFNPERGPQKLMYRLQEPSAVFVTIVDLLGNLVREIEVPNGGEGGRPEDNVIFWDGRNGEGNTVGNGGYIIRIEAVTAGDRSNSATDKSAVVK